MPESTSGMVSFSVRDQADLLVGMRRVHEQGLLADADEVERSLVVTMISELATNIMKYAGQGTVRVARSRQPDGVDIEIWADDQGPGIESVDHAMRDHFTTGNTLGLGFRACDAWPTTSRSSPPPDGAPTCTPGDGSPEGHPSVRLPHAATRRRRLRGQRNDRRRDGNWA